MLYTLRFFFSSKCSLFHNANLFGFCIIHILCTGYAKIKKNNNNSGAKGTMELQLFAAKELKTEFSYNLRCNEIHLSDRNSERRNSMVC